MLKNVSGKKVLILFVIYLIFAAVIFPALPHSNAGIPDIKYYYSAEDIYQIIANYTPAERRNYALSSMTVDVLYPLVYSLFLTALSIFLIGKLISKAQKGINAILDIGALHGRAINIDERGKVLGYRMTSQCASGSGQFIENIARYLGISQDEIGELSKQADNPEKVSGICAVLAETDVINMVSRQISAANILKGIHESMAMRLVKLLRASKVKTGKVLLTGGLALDDGLRAALAEQMEKQKIQVSVGSHPDSIYAGAMGAAIWGAFRHEKLSRMGALDMAS